MKGELGDAVVIGDPAVLRRAGSVMTAVIEQPADLEQVPPGCLPVIAPPGLTADLAALQLGLVDARNGAAAARCIEHAVRCVMAGEARAIVTAPIDRKSVV